MVNLSDKKTRREIGMSCACFNLRRAARLVTQRFDRALQESGITANQFSILMAAYNQDGILLTKLAKNSGYGKDDAESQRLLAGEYGNGVYLSR